MKSRSNEGGCLSITDAEKVVYEHLALASLPYAILITGPWGCGKTHFTQKIVQAYRGNDLRFCYISLFGLNSVEQVNHEVVMADLMSRSTVTGKVTRAAQRILSSVTFRGVTFNIGNTFKELDKQLRFFHDDQRKPVYIFDDIERCMLSPALLLGCINACIDEEGSKVIVIGDEQKIGAPGEKASGNTEGQPNEAQALFALFKEKVIGLTLPLQGDATAALDQAIARMRETQEASSACECLERHKSLILDIFLEGKHTNMRHFGKLAIEFYRIVQTLSEKARSDAAFMKDLVETMTRLSFRYHTSNQVYKQEDERYLCYAALDPQAVHDLGDFWINYFQYGTIGTDLLNWYRAKTQEVDVPSYRKLNSYCGIDESAFLNLYNQVRSALEKKEYKEVAEILQVYDALLSKEEFSGLDISCSELEREIKEYLRVLIEPDDFNLQSKEPMLREHYTYYESPTGNFERSAQQNVGAYLRTEDGC